MQPEQDGSELDLLARIMRTAPYAVSICDAEGRVIAMNDRCRALYGDFINNSRWQDRFKVTDQDGNVLSADQFPIMRSLRGETVEEETFYIETNGWAVPRKFLISSHPILRADQIVGAISLHRDGK